MDISIDDMREKIKNIDIKKASEEILNWLIENVEQYIDNKETIFSLYFPIDKVHLEKMDHIFNLGSLYCSFEEKKIKNERECIKVLDDVVDLVRLEMLENKELLGKLFKRLIYYYEMVGFSMKTGAVIQEMDGYVSINKFFYEPIGMDVIVTKKWNKKMPDGSMVDSGKKAEVVKQERIPEGFVVEIELKKWSKQNMTSVI